MGFPVKTPGINTRIKELLYDWLFIWVYLLALFSVIMVVYLVLIGGIPVFNSMQSQLVATLTTVVPLILVFTIMEGREPFASYGKRKMNLTVIYKGNPKTGSLIRNTLKLLPWQFGHMSTISGIYNGFDSMFSIVFFSLSMLLSLTYISMAFFGKNNRHLADLIAGSTVVVKQMNH